MKSKNEPVIDGQETIPMKRPMQPIDIDTLSMQKTLMKALSYCITVSGIEDDKQIRMELGIDAGHWTRIMKGEAHFPLNKLNHLMDYCGNEAPLYWLAENRGYELTPKESELERENRILREKLAASEHEKQVIINAFKGGA